MCGQSGEHVVGNMSYSVSGRGQTNLYESNANLSDMTDSYSEFLSASSEALVHTYYSHHCLTLLPALSHSCGSGPHLGMTAAISSARATAASSARPLRASRTGRRAGSSSEETDAAGLETDVAEDAVGVPPPVQYRRRIIGIATGRAASCSSSPPPRISWGSCGCWDRGR